MKKILKFKIIAGLLLFIMVSSSCLKDSEHDWDFSGNKPMIEIPEVPNASTGLIVRAIVIAPSIDVKIPINLASPNVLDRDIKVTLAVDPDLLVAYNANLVVSDPKALPFEILPADKYTIPSLEVTIPAGKRLVDFIIKVKSDQVDLTKKYILPIKITQVSEGLTIARNFGTGLVSILLKNKWDGIYTVEGTFTEYVGAGFTGDYPKTIHLITSSGNTCAYFDPNLNGGTYGYRFLADGAGTYFGNWCPVFAFDDATGNVTAVTNFYNDPLPRGRSAALATDQGCPNKVNADKSIDVAYYLVQENVSPKKRSLIIDKFTYVGPRP